MTSATSGRRECAARECQVHDALRAGGDFDLRRTGFRCGRLRGPRVPSLGKERTIVGERVSGQREPVGIGPLEESVVGASRNRRGLGNAAGKHLGHPVRTGPTTAELEEAACRWKVDLSLAEAGLTSRRVQESRAKHAAFGVDEPGIANSDRPRGHINLDMRAVANSVARPSSNPSRTSCVDSADG